jgi:hypothetical protein
MASTQKDSGHYTEEGTGFVDATRPDAVEEARKRHHLATADPEPERGDGTLTGPAHEEKYGLDRAEGSAAAWRSVGVHPTENRALVDGEDGRRTCAAFRPQMRRATPKPPPAPRASDKK